MSRETPIPAADLNADDLRIGIVVSRFNGRITRKLLHGAKETLLELGADEDRLHVLEVPGCLEIPTIAAKMADSGRVDAIVCLGCVIRGGTAHFDHVCRVVMDGIGQVALRGTVGVGNGVLTVDSVDQAWERCGGTYGHKGTEAALAAVEVCRRLRQLDDLFARVRPA